METNAKSTADESAFPVATHDTEGRTGVIEYGLTKREYFAAMAMQGLMTKDYIKLNLSEQNVYDGWQSVEMVAKLSVLMADALLSALSKQ